MKLVLCDDNPLHAQKTALMIQRTYPDLILRAFGSAIDLLESLESEQYDLALIDIDMPDINGITLAKSLNAHNPTCKIIFVTAYLNFATDVYESRHANFILKSEISRRLPNALEKVLQEIDSERTASIIIRQKARTLKILQKDIIFIERIRRTSYIHCTDQVYAASETLPELEQKLKASDFIRCHNSFIINISSIKELKRAQTTTIGGADIPISRAYSENVKLAFARFMGERL